MLKFLKDKKHKKDFLRGANETFIFFKEIYEICRFLPNGSEQESIILNGWYRKHKNSVKTAYFDGCMETYRLFILHEERASSTMLHIKPVIRTTTLEVFNATIR